ncbi:hypothetical protein ACTUVK_003716 [Stenotrophomonas rhizophila]|uniref:Hydrolase n=1 Tax=Stenotrophomonas nematodicola TaxID=2656746 RepID=A0ABW7CWR4_9GAMM
MEASKAVVGNTLTMPVLAVGGETSFAANEAVVMRSAAVDVTEGGIAGARHWLTEEAPQATVAAGVRFIDALAPRQRGARAGWHLNVVRGVDAAWTRFHRSLQARGGDFPHVLRVRRRP